MRRFLYAVFGVFVGLYVLALALFLIGNFGLFGQERDPLSGLFLLPLGFPWFLVSRLFSAEASPWIAALAPLVNIAILKWIINRWAAKPEDFHA